MFRFLFFYGVRNYQLEIVAFSRGWGQSLHGWKQSHVPVKVYLGIFALTHILMYFYQMGKSRLNQTKLQYTIRKLNKFSALKGLLIYFKEGHHAWQIHYVFYRKPSHIINIMVDIYIAVFLFLKSVPHCFCSQNFAEKPQLKIMSFENTNMDI